MKQILRKFSFALLVLVGVQVASSQVGIRATMGKKEFVAYENVSMSVTMTNRAGQDIDFMNKPGVPWMDFVVERVGGQPIFKAAAVNYKPTRLKTGETKTSSFSLNNLYSLTDPGNYTAYAVLRMPGQGPGNGTRSDKIHFTIINGNPVWKQRAGVPGSPGDTREFRIMNIRGAAATELYVQVEDVKRGKMLATYSMGRNLGFREFTATLDNRNRMHVLFQTNPTVYSHTVVDAAGKTVRREYHKKAANGALPKLITTSNGVVGVAQSTPFDPEAANDLKSKLHNLSELPLGL